MFLWSNQNFLHISLWITLPTHFCLVLFSFCGNLLHALIILLIVSSLSPHNLHLLFCGVLSLLAFICLVLEALFCAAIWRDSVSLLKFPFITHVQVFSSEMLLLVVLSVHNVFLPFLFPYYCRSVGHRVVSIIFDGCNKSSFVFFYVVLELVCQCVNTVFNAGKSFSSLLSWYI